MPVSLRCHLVFRIDWLSPWRYLEGQETAFLDILGTDKILMDNVRNFESLLRNMANVSVLIVDAGEIV